MLISLKTKIQHNSCDIYFEQNKAAEAIAILAKREGVNPLVCINGLFAAMLEIVDPDKQFFNILYTESYDSGPAVAHILNSNVKGYCILYFHDPRLIDKQGIFENSLLVKTYINLVALYLYKTENPHGNLSDNIEITRRMEQVIQSTTNYSPNKYVAKMTIPNNKLMELINHEAMHRTIRKDKISEQSPTRHDLKMCC